VLAISITRTEAHVIRHLQERMPYWLWLYVPDEYREGFREARDEPLRKTPTWGDGRGSAHRDVGRDVTTLLR
jgi:hypothetical protein